MFQKTSNLIGWLFNMQLIRAGLTYSTIETLGNPLGCPPPPHTPNRKSESDRWTHTLQWVWLTAIHWYSAHFHFHSKVSKNFDSSFWRKTSKIFSPNGSSLSICERGEWVARTQYLDVSGRYLVGSGRLRTALNGVRTALDGTGRLRTAPDGN